MRLFVRGPLAAGLASLAASCGGTVAPSVSGPTCSQACVGSGSPVTLASGQDHPSSVAVYGGVAYWTNASAATVMKVATSGGTPVTFADQAEPPAYGPVQLGPLAVFPPNVYWWYAISGPFDGNNGYVTQMFAPLAGGKPGETGGSVMGVGTSVGGIAATSTEQFWAFTANDSILRTRETDGGGSGGAFVKGSRPYAPFGLATDATNVDWSESTASGSVMMAAIESGAAVPLATAQSAPGWLAIDTSAVYWVNTGDGSIMKVGKAGGTPRLSRRDRTGRTASR